MNKHRIPDWLVLDTLMLLILGLLVHERHLFVPPGHHLFAQLALTLLVYGLLELWLLTRAPAFPISEHRMGDQERGDANRGCDETSELFAPRQIHYHQVIAAQRDKKTGGRIRIWRPRDGA